AAGRRRWHPARHGLGVVGYGRLHGGHGLGPEGSAPFLLLPLSEPFCSRAGGARNGHAARPDRGAVRLAVGESGAERAWLESACPRSAPSPSVAHGLSWAV